MTTITVTHKRFPEANGSHGNAYAKNRLVQEWRTLAKIEARKLRLVTVPSPVTLDVQVHRTSRRNQRVLGGQGGHRRAGVRGRTPGRL